MIGNSQKEFDVLITLVDNKLWHYRLNLLSGNLTEGSQSFTDALSILNGVASGYETFFNATYSGDFAQAVMKASENQTRQVENDKSSLKIKYAEAESTLLEYTQVQWFQKINNQFMSPFRSIAASVSETGLLTRFTDNIALHWVATTNIATSKENAISIAMQTFRRMLVSMSNK
jgi:hypothetical protein